jgi:DNA-binding transcriptional LysR family regulator
MNHSTLQIFIQVADTQSVTLAAKRLGRAQSNITTRIQQLEEELAVELFVRGNKKWCCRRQAYSFSAMPGGS